MRVRLAKNAASVETGEKTSALVKETACSKVAKVYAALKMTYALTPEVLSPSVSGRCKYGKLKRSE